LDNIFFHKVTNSLTRHRPPTIQQNAVSLGTQLHDIAPYCPFVDQVETYFSIRRNTFVRRSRPGIDEELRLSFAEAVESKGQENLRKYLSTVYIKWN